MYDRDRAFAREIAHALLALEDAPLREAALFARLAAMTPVEGAAFLSGLVALAVDRDPAATPLIPLFSDVKALAGALGPRQMAALLEAARETDRDGVVKFLAARSPRRAATGAEAPPAGSTSDALPLGRRTQIGRTGSRTDMDRLIYDQDPRVVENLLRNPRCTEREVLRIAAHRPTSAAVLSVLFHHPRWIARYPIKRALALNPYATPAQAIGLLPSLLTQDLAVIAGDETIHPDVAGAAERLLGARGAVSAQAAPPAPRPALPATGTPLPETLEAVAESREAVDAVAAAFLASLRDEVEAVVAELGEVVSVSGHAGARPGAGEDPEDDVLEIEMTEVTEMDLAVIRDEAAAAQRRQLERR
jgi:hypothetical protein